MRPLVILRPEPGASATADAARSLGLDPILVPLFRIEPVSWTAPDPSDFDGLLITSANAIRFGGSELCKLKALPVCAVGEATAAAAREADFNVEAFGYGGVDALLGSIAPDLRLLHLCGVDRRAPNSPSSKIAAIAVYRSAELSHPKHLDRLTGGVVAVHSQRAAARLAEVTNEAGVARNRIAIVAISADAAAAAGGDWQQIEAANQPNDRALLALAARLCHNEEQ